MSFPHIGKPGRCAEWSRLVGMVHTLWSDLPSVLPQLSKGIWQRVSYQPLLSFLRMAHGKRSRGIQEMPLIFRGRGGGISGYKINRWMYSHLLPSWGSWYCVCEPTTSEGGGIGEDMPSYLGMRVGSSRYGRGQLSMGARGWCRLRISEQLWHMPCRSSLYFCTWSVKLIIFPFFYI